MSLRINTNTSAFNAYRNLSVTSNLMNGSLEKLSSGYRINKAADDAAGLAISESLKSQINGLTVAVRNAQDGVSVVQTAEGALNETTAILQRMRDLAVQANNAGAQNDTSIGGLDTEFQQLASELDDIATGTIDYANDRQGRRRAFWITQIGSLYGLTPDGAAVATDSYPEDVDAFCDPCEFWDDQNACVEPALDEGTGTTANLGGALLASLCGAGGDTAVATTTLGLICLLILPAVRPRP